MTTEPDNQTEPHKAAKTTNRLLIILILVILLGFCGLCFMSQIGIAFVDGFLQGLAGG
jgi:hypothetical protein